MKKIIISLLSISLLGLANANEQTGELKSTATMNATCSISTDSINFGVVATPLMMQTASSEMNVKCSNSSAYTVDLAYGGIYGQGSVSTGYLLGYAISGADTSQYNVYNSSGTNIGYFHCRTNGSTLFSNTTVSNIYGVSYSSSWINNSITNACTTNGTLAGTYPKGWTGSYNATGRQSLGGASYSYGIMIGMSKGDTLAYSIAVPGDSNKVWNKGQNSHQATGNGEVQTIPMNAKIVPDKSASKYPAPDMYLDTVTAIISY